MFPSVSLLYFWEKEIEKEWNREIDQFRQNTEIWKRTSLSNALKVRSCHLQGFRCSLFFSFLRDLQGIGKNWEFSSDKSKSKRGKKMWWRIVSFCTKKNRASLKNSCNAEEEKRFLNIWVCKGGYTFAMVMTTILSQLLIRGSFLPIPFIYILFECLAPTPRQPATRSCNSAGLPSLFLGASLPTKK